MNVHPRMPDAAKTAQSTVRKPAKAAQRAAAVGKAAAEAKAGQAAQSAERKPARGTDPCLSLVRAPAYFLLLVDGYEQTHKAQGVLADASWYARALGRILVEPAVKVRSLSTRSTCAQAWRSSLSTPRGNLPYG
jgi:hypothetical protein